MSTRKRGRLGWALGFALALVLLPTGAWLLRAYGPGGMWLGYLIGGGITVALIGFALWRAERAPQSATTAERIVSQRADERDLAVRNRALTVVGAASIPLSSLVATAVALGLAPGPAFAILLWSLLGILAVAFLRASRSM